MAVGCRAYAWRVAGRDLLSGHETVDGKPEHVSLLFVVRCVCAE